MNFASCNSCGVVVDLDVPTMEHETVFNHDGDKKCVAVKYPVCKELIPNEEWEEVE